jgi:hypothetical protein
VRVHELSGSRQVTIVARGDEGRLCSQGFVETALLGCFLVGSASQFGEAPFLLGHGGFYADPLLFQLPALLCGCRLARALLLNVPLLLLELGLLASRVVDLFLLRCQRATLGLEYFLLLTLTLSRFLGTPLALGPRSCCRSNGSGSCF